MAPSWTPGAYSCMRSIQACPLGTTGAYRGHQVCIDGALCLFFNAHFCTLFKFSFGG